MKTILCIGHSTIDIFFEITEANILKSKDHQLELCMSFPEKIYIPKRGISLGGNAVNVGVGLLTNKYTIRLISRTGDDALGSIIYTNLMELGFNLDYTSKEGESDSSVILFHENDRSILSYHGKTPYRFPVEVPYVEWVYLSSLGFDDYQSLHLPLLNWLAKNPESKLLYNPGENEIKNGFASVEGIMKRAHSVILNKEEAHSMIGKICTDHFDYSIKKLLETYIELGVKNIIITDGKNGAYYASEKNAYYYIPILEVKVIDSTGAGDAFSSGYLTALIEGVRPSKAVKYGMAQSASCIQEVGAIHGLQNFEELTIILQQHPEVECEERFNE